MRRLVPRIMLMLLLTGMFSSVFNLFFVATEQPPMEWEHAYGGTNDDHAIDCAEGDGGYASAGSTRSYGAGSVDFWLVKTDPSGNMVWNKTYGRFTRRDRILCDIRQVTEDMHWQATSSPLLNYDFWLVKTDAAAEMSNGSKSFGGAGEEMAYSVIQMGEAGFGLVGDTNSKGAGGKDFWLG